MEAIFVVLLILLGLLFCSRQFSGTGAGAEGFTTGSNTGEDTKAQIVAKRGSGKPKFDNYNHYTGAADRLESGSTFTASAGEKAIVGTNLDGSQYLQITLPGMTTPVVFTSTATASGAADATATGGVEGYVNYYGPNGEAYIFYGPNGATATVIIGDNGREAIKVVTNSGTYYYYDNGHGGSAAAAITSTQYFGATGNTLPPQSPLLTGGSVTGPGGNTAFYAQGPAGNGVAGVAATSNYDYSSLLPPGIPRSQIPSGQEDLYILKSEVIPPVCPPATVIRVPGEVDKSKCPPCPACARCPDPPMTCKAVPNYDAISQYNNSNYPMPMLSDFSAF